MIRKLALFCIVLLINVSFINAQEELECKTKLSLFNQSTKAKKYDAAYKPWLYVRNNCPELSLAIYADGEKILKHKIKTTKDDEKISFIKALIELWKDRSQYYKSKTPHGEYKAKACQLMYDNKDILPKTKGELYDCFNAAFVSDLKTFRHPKSLYSYFSLMVNLFDEGEKTDVELFNTYDDISDKIEVEIQNYSKKQNILLVKLENGDLLTQKEKNKKTAYQSYLKNYTLIQNNINVKLDTRAICKNLIPLYKRGFEANRNDGVWLKRAVNRMYHKECTDDPFYEILVKQYDEVLPSADSKVFVATVLIKNGKTAEAFKYLEQAYQLETKPYKKSKLAYRIGLILKKKKQYRKARGYFNKALKLNPSNGKPHLSIALMYSDSAKDCGKDNFYQRAVFWLAAEEARKASRKYPTLKKIALQYAASYEAKAPTKEEIFLKDMGGKTIKIECWINSSIIVPKD